MYWRWPCAMQPNKIRNSCCRSFFTRLFVSGCLSKLDVCCLNWSRAGGKSERNLIRTQRWFLHYGTRNYHTREKWPKIACCECHTLSSVMNWGIWSVARLIFVNATIFRERRKIQFLSPLYWWTNKSTKSVISHFNVKFESIIHKYWLVIEC